ncbi:unnamed protein product [Brassica rapa]|uniref:Uncharacterized protein n=2 Tax=Brassica TaxID=3705 RepID=A0A8D9CQT2_BRACM|nr:unnamed protein product [Brassica napus]CAG7861626.1 unnamed protein product [Brassica rapa]
MKPQLQPYHRSARSDPDPVKTTQNTSNPEFSGFTSWGGTQSWWAPISDPADPFQIWSVFGGLVRVRGRPLVPLNSSLGFGWFFCSEQFSISSTESLRVGGA